MIAAEWLDTMGYTGTIVCNVKAEVDTKVLQSPQLERLQKSHANTNDVLDVNFYNDKCTRVKFYDGSEEKAVVQDGDTFSKEFGVAMCLIYHQFGGRQKFYKAIRQAMNVYNDKVKSQKVIEKALEDEKRAEEKMRKNELKRRKAAEEREIRIHTEAYKRALMDLMGSEVEDDCK